MGLHPRRVDGIFNCERFLDTAGKGRHGQPREADLPVEEIARRPAGLCRSNNLGFFCRIRHEAGCRSSCYSWRGGHAHRGEHGATAVPEGLAGGAGERTSRCGQTDLTPQGELSHISRRDRRPLMHTSGLEVREQPLLRRFDGPKCWSNDWPKRSNATSVAWGGDSSTMIEDLPVPAPISSTRPAPAARIGDLQL
jgi:hypothetical protein